MRAMILAAGRGERMRPLTDRTPKPLLEAGGQPLIVWHVRRLVDAGIRDIIVNHAWLGGQIETFLGDGSAYGARLRYSPESPALETAGGIARALPFFEGEPFLTVNGDVWCDWDFGTAQATAAGLSPEHCGHLLLVDNPVHHREGDFALLPRGIASPPIGSEPTLTFSGIGLYHPAFFARTDPDHPAPLAPLLRAAMADRRITAEHYKGQWVDVGTPERLAALDAKLRRAAC